MATFIRDVLKNLQKNRANLSQLTFVLPSKRSCLFLKHQLPGIIHQSIFSPEIISIEDFIENLSGLKTVSSTELLFQFYDTYKAITKPSNQDTFEIFSKWAQILIQDFNEIDKYLIPQENIFNYLSAIKEIENKHWSLEEEQTDFIKNYLLFWNKLNDYYSHFSKALLNKKTGYQGLIYREAVNNLKTYIESNLEKQHVFIGFNALNTSEQTIIRELLQNNLAEMYWDIDAVFFNNKKHSASFFIRKYEAEWAHFKINPFNWITDRYSKDKNITILGVPKNVGQAKQVGTILRNLKREKSTLDHTAVILGDENLSIPVLNSIPQGVNALNITMGFPLKTVPLANLFESLFHLHRINSKRFYHKDVCNVLSNQFIRPLFQENGIDSVSHIIETINSNNLVYLSVDQLKELDVSSHILIDLLFANWNMSPDNALEKCFQLIIKIKNQLEKRKADNLLPLEYLFRFNSLFNEISRLNTLYQHINNISTLFNIYKELLQTETLNFQGEPLQGLQIMGMLESRVLDFDTVVITSVNEGILPSGKTNNSFIPFDVKLENKLPTYKDKDAIYTYHFYRLLQRAKNIYILYNTEADVLTGGEKSRFITQLELEGIHNIKHEIVAPQVPVLIHEPKIVDKNEALLLTLKDVAKKGFSPSTLTNYMRNPIDFYYKKILKIKEFNAVEETVAANTLGTIVHNTLEDLYKPLIGAYLTVEIVKKLKTQIETKVQFYFKNEFKEGDITKGKNLIIFEIAKRYVFNFLNLELKELKAQNKIKIVAIEANNSIKINIPELDFPVHLTGKVDRVDEYNGITRIIDYKTSKVELSKVEVTHWEDITTHYERYSKSFQVLSYAYMLVNSKQITLPIEAGIISFKNLNQGFLKFSKKDKSGRGAIKDSIITQNTLDSFGEELKKLIIEICNKTIPFTEKVEL